MDITGAPLDATSIIPGLATAVVRHARAAAEPEIRLAVERIGSNDWALSMTPSPTTSAAIHAELLHHFSPATTLATVGERLAELTPVRAALLRVEHDTCGAWVTLSSAGHPRPFCLRRAGWADLRGHPIGPLGADGPAPLDDRIGLGPGDALVQCHVDGFGPDDQDDLLEVQLDALLTVAGAPAEEVADRLVAATAAHVDAGIVVVVLRVPDDLGDDPVQRIVDATGVTREELALPGYPLGDLQPELWHEPPIPPRVARLRLGPTAADLAAVRELLRRLVGSWRLGGRLADRDVELLATEVATNALRHAGTEFDVTIAYLGPSLRVEVRDASNELPRRREPDPDDGGGRGIWLVDLLASDWGVEAGDSGKRVWFEVPVTHPH